VAVSPDGNTLASGDWKGEIRLWDRTADDVATLLSAPNRFMVKRVLDVRFDTRGHHLVCVTNDNDCVQWDLRSRDQRAQRIDGALRAAHGSTPATLLVTTSSGSLVRIDTVTGDTLDLIPGHGVAGTALAVDPVGNLVAVGGPDSTITIRALPGLSSIAVIAAGFAVRTLDFSADRSRLIGAGGGGRIRSWNAGSWTLEDSLEAGPAALIGVVVHPDGLHFVTCSEEGEVLRWGPNGRSPESRIVPGASGATCIGISPDGSRLATGTANGLVRIYDFESGRELVALQGHTARLAALAWSPGGELLATGANDGTVRLWEGGPRREP
jgi:WD40 repeat protein